MGNNSSSSSNGTSSNSNQAHIDAQVSSYLENAKQEFENKYAQPAKQTAKLEDFQLQRTVGTGSFGRVMIVQHGNQSLALKIMEKQNIVKLKQVEHTLSEKRILQAIKFPFLVNLVYSFKDNSHLYLALDFASGGEMFTHLRWDRIRLTTRWLHEVLFRSSRSVGKYPEDQTRFYAAQVTLAFEYLHYLSQWHSTGDDRSFESLLSVFRYYLSWSETWKYPLLCGWLFENNRFRLRQSRSWSYLHAVWNTWSKHHCFATPHTDGSLSSTLLRRSSFRVVITKVSITGH